MTWVEIIGLAITLLVMVVGLAGSILPGIPSTPLVFIAAIGHRLAFGDRGAATWVIVLLCGLMLFSMLLDFLASMAGAKHLGATWRGVCGAAVGGLIGLFLGLPGLLLGPFLGAIAFEMAGGREWRESAKAGAGAALGLLAGAIGKLACCAAMIFLFVANVLWRAFSAAPDAPVLETMLRGWWA